MLAKGKRTLWIFHFGNLSLREARRWCKALPLFKGYPSGGLLQPAYNQRNSLARRFRLTLHSFPLALHSGESRSAAAGQLFIYALKAWVNKQFLGAKQSAGADAE